MNRSRVILMLAASSAALLTAEAHAQEAPAASPEGEIVITGTRASLENAENIKRNSAVVVDGITADDIGQLPDVSISESLIRITGVSSNDTVRGSDQVAVRGLGPDLVSTEYNGRILPTADGATRRVGLAGLPTEGISAAMAQKTPQASSIEGGVAGILQLQSVHPLETRRKGLTLVARGLYSDTADSVSRDKNIAPFGGRAEVTYVGKLAQNFGVALSYSYVKQYSAERAVQLDGWALGTTTRADTNNDGVTDAVAGTAGPFLGSFVTERHAVLGTAQWDPTESIRVTVDGLFNSDHYVQSTRRYFATNLFNGALGAPTEPTTVENDVVTSFAGTAAQYRGIISRSDIKDHTYAGGLNVAFDNGGPIKAKIDFWYADAGRDRYTPQVNFENDAATAVAQRMPVSYDITDPANTVIAFTELTAEDYAIQQATTVKQDSSDVIKSVRADFTWEPTSASFLKSIDFGARFDDRRHTQRVDNTLYNFANLAARPDLDSSYLENSRNAMADSPANFGGAAAVTFPYYDFDKLMQLATNAAGVQVNDQYATDIASNADVQETTYALYAQANLSSGPFSGNIGLRWLLTDQVVLGAAGTTPANTVPQRFANSYNYFLPSLNLRYELTPKTLIRFGASKTISRPQFQFLSVGSAIDLTTVNSGTPVTISRGNPELQPYAAKSVDLGFEWYPNRSTSFAVAGYYKWVTNFTVTATEATTITLPDGTTTPAFITSTINDPTERHFRGIEAQFRKEFDFLPGFLKDMGVQANWNHNLTDARETFTSLVGSTVPVLPINFSRDVVNAQLYYSKAGIDLRAAYRYYSGYSRAFANGYQFMPAGQFDLNAGYTLRKGVRLTGTITNLLDSPVYRTTADYRDLSSQSILQHYAYQGRTVTIGVRLQL